MEHVAIDLGARNSQICRRAPDETILEERSIETRRLGEYLMKLAPSRVILETSAEAFAVADQALEAGHEVRVVPATLSRSLGVGRRKLKSDQRDSRAISEVSCRVDLPSVHVPSALSRELKRICTSREALVSSRTKLVNRVRGHLRTEIDSIRCTAEALPARLRARASERGEVLLPDIEAVLAVVELITKQVRELDTQLRTLAREIEPCRRMMTVPGVGPVTAVRFFAALDDRGRFDSASAVQSYLGLTPGLHQSGATSRRTGITKAGAAPVRRTLVQAAWAFWRFRPDDPVAQWAHAVAERRGKQIAVVALARKLAGILFAIWRDAKPYDPQHQAKKLPTDRETIATGLAAAAP